MLSLKEILKKYALNPHRYEKNGKVYKAFNVQNDGILSICAERAAFIKALTEGHKKFKCIVITGKKVGGKSKHSKLLGDLRAFIGWAVWGLDDGISLTWWQTCLTPV